MQRPASSILNAVTGDDDRNDDKKRRQIVVNARNQADSRFRPETATKCSGKCSTQIVNVLFAENLL